MTVLVNLTPHVLRVIGSSGDALVEVDAAELSARLVEDHGQEANLAVGLGGFELVVPVVPVRYGAVRNLPDPSAGAVFVVSRLTAMAVGGRVDVLFPMDEVRDADGQIVGCRKLGRIVPVDADPA